MKIVLISMLVVLLGLQVFQVEIENPVTEKSLEIKAPLEVMEVFKRACYDCHSNEVVIPWYSKIAPASFFIKGHVDLGRKWLNFSEWEKYTQKQKDEKLKGIFRTVYAAMPLPSYLWLHKDAKLTKDEIKMIRDWTGKAPY